MILKTGATLGPYEIAAPLGKGGMGEVYRARDTRLGRDVAIKILAERLSGQSEALARLSQEAKALAALNHPHILTVFDVGSEGGTAYIVFELLDGRTLASRLADSALEWPEVRRIALAIAEGLAAAHAKGVIHRDLKPENVFLGSDGKVKLVDFGLARVRPAGTIRASDDSTRTRATQLGTVMGSLGYMAPEQLRGRPVDARCDIFSFGCVLFEMLCGRPALLRDSAADTMAATLAQQPVDLSHLGNQAPKDLQDLIARCMEQDPARRFPTGRDLCDALAAVGGAAAAPRTRRARKVCVCGRSKSLPFCDASHVGENWTCAQESESASMGFCSSERYQNLANKLASHYQGALCLPGHPWPAVDRLITIVDGTDLEFPLNAHGAIRARKRVVFVLGVSAGLLRHLFGNCRVVDLGDAEPFAAFRQIQEVLDGGEPRIGDDDAPLGLHSAFISHAVDDEPTLVPAMNYLRKHFAADLFLCADSIPSGADWQGTILAALRAKECFVAMLSEAANASQFCSFEMGAAAAMGKPLKLISLDGVDPPSFVQHIQVVHLPRMVSRKPWLDIHDVLLQGLLNSIARPVVELPE